MKSRVHGQLYVLMTMKKFREICVVFYISFPESWVSYYDFSWEKQPFILTLSVSPKFWDFFLFLYAFFQSRVWIVLLPAEKIWAKISIFGGNFSPVGFRSEYDVARGRLNGRACLHHYHVLEELRMTKVGRVMVCRYTTMWGTSCPAVCSWLL